MYKPTFNKQKAIIFKQFTRKGYALFACLGRVVIIGTLSVPTLTYAKANGVSIRTELASDTLNQQEVRLDEVIVTGSRAPLSAWQSPRIVALINRDDIERTQATSINDLLKIATGVDVRQRGGFGVQTDISINGGTFDQITILLNGINISNPQTGHNASDFPVSLSDIERIEILEGAASRIFGSSAFSGAINIVTKNKKNDYDMQTAVEGGMHGTVTGEGQLFIEPNDKHSHLISGGYGRSDGGTDNSDFKKGRLFYQGRWGSKMIDLNWQLAASTQSYGANTFYSPKYNNQYEKTRHAIFSLAANISLNQHITISPTLYFNQFNDHYQLIRNQEGAKNGENYHTMNVYGASLNFLFNSQWGKTSIGSDLRKEHLLSTAYGELLDEKDWKDISGSNRKYDKKGDRTNVSVFAEHNILLNHWTISAGLLFNHITPPTSQLSSTSSVSPGIDISFRPSNHWKLTASWNNAIRVPTYTDLYTNNVAQQGDINLKPEKNNTFKVVSKWLYPYMEIATSAFYSHGNNLIDWVFESAESTKYHALNIGKVDNAGASITANIDLAILAPHNNVSLPQLKVGYAYIHQEHETEHTIYKSLYALEYLRHKVTVQLSQRIWKHLSASCQYRWQQRTNGFTPYSKIDAKIQWDSPKYSLYVNIDNLTNHRYYDIGSVLQPGIWVMVGGKYRFSLFKW